MATIGIIAEYNPFHNGHKYQLNRIKQLHNDANIISVMSGDFLQRGTPAMADKYDRALLAATEGVDAVFELPVIYACGSAHDFAYGAVSLLNATDYVDMLCFGAETDDISIFNKIADALYSESASYKQSLSSYLKQGVSFPMARNLAVNDILGASYGEFMKKPNNILGIEYILALKKLNSKITPLIIKREVADYHSENLTGGISSASAIRHAILEGSDISDAISPSAISILSPYIKNGLLTEDSLTPYLAYIHDVLLCDNQNAMLNISDINPDILNRFIKLKFPQSFSQAADNMKSKNVTMTRINRILLHMILNITDDLRQDALNSAPSYLNLLAFRHEKSSVLRSISENDTITIINKKADFTPSTKTEDGLWSLDIKAKSLYNQLIYSRFGIVLSNELQSTVKISKVDS